MGHKDFKDILFGYQKGVKQELKMFFRKKLSGSDQPFEREIMMVLEEFSLRPAKRIRPILVNVGYFLAGGEDKRAIIEASISVELIHNMLLIHDDIVDQDELRRGGKTVHYLYGGKHYGESMALVAGDIIGFLGYGILNSSRFPAENRILAAERLGEILVKTGYGQMMETKIKERPFSGETEEKDVLEIYQLKTALYSFVGPLQIGALLAGAEEDFLGKIERFALPMGIAFQIQDDLRDEDSIKANNRESVQKYINQSREAIISEKDFPSQEKQFLLNLADYILKGEY